jgi:ribose transport system ATP-binding protein
MSTVSLVENNALDVEVCELKKAFGRNRVLKGVSFAVKSGDFVGLMGPNGAGKSTLIKILAGVYRASSGEIKVDGKTVGSLTETGDVGFIHQDLGLADDLTIAENFTLGAQPRRLFGPILNKSAERDAAKQALDRLGLALDVDTPVGDLTVGEKTLVAVARVFDRGARVLVIDETTSTLPPSDAKRVIATLRVAAAAGASVIMVTHKLSEILDTTNRVLVLVDGDLVANAPTAGLDRAALVGMLRQHEADAPTEGDRAGAGDDGETLIELRDAKVGRLRPINLSLRAGEIVGISGLLGSGLHDIAFTVNGNLAPESGEVVLSRPGLTRALVPPHRESQGGFNELTVRENMALSSLPAWRRMRALLDPRPERDECELIMKNLAVVPNSLDAPFEVLSGGNKQKVIFGRALLNHPDVYVLCEPTRGVDVGTRSEIYRLIRSLAADGAAVLVASSDAEDLFSVCDRAALIVSGGLQPFRPVSQLTPAELEMMV